MSDDSLGIQAPNPLSVESLIRAHYETLYRYAFRLTGQQCDAEDLTQQTFLTAQRKLHQLRQPEAVRGWLFQILRTAFLKTCRKKTPQFETDSELTISDVAAVDTKETPFDIEHLQQRLDELPDAFRVALLMFYFEGKSYEQISTELDVPLGTVMSRLSRAKTHLRRRMKPAETTK